MDGEIQSLPLTQLVPFRGVNGKGQSRQHFEPKGLEELAQSMREIGFIEPVLCRPIENGQYELIGGHRRCKAAALAGLAEVSAVVKPMTDREALATMVADNCNREDFLPWELGSGFQDLADSGYTVQDVAANVGKSADFVRGRIRLHTGLGETARRLYLRKELTLAALDLLAALPDHNMAPVACPYCRTVSPDGTTTCPGCQKDLSGVFRCDSGNPQDTAARACAGKTNGAVADAILRVREAYGIAEKPVQCAFVGFTTDEVDQGAIEVRTELERRLGDIAKAEAWFADHAAKVAELPAHQRKAIVAQSEVAMVILRRIMDAAALPEAQAGATLAFAM